MSEKTPDQVGGYDWMLCYDSGDSWEDSGYAYSRTAEGPMNETEAKLQLSSRPSEERPVLYKLVTPEQLSACANRSESEIAAAFALLDNREKVVARVKDALATLKAVDPHITFVDLGGSIENSVAGCTEALALLEAEKEGDA